MSAPHKEPEAPPGFWSSRHAIGLVVMGGVAAWFLLSEHLAHLLGVLPYLFLLACPLMHVFMHGRHGHHGHHHHDPGDGAGRTGTGKPGEPS